jgi:hypothetical protein
MIGSHIVDGDPIGLRSGGLRPVGLRSGAIGLSVTTRGIRAEQSTEPANPEYLLHLPDKARQAPSRAV